MKVVKVGEVGLRVCFTTGSLIRLGVGLGGFR